MNEQNADYLNRQIKFTGFGENLARELKEKMTTGVADFTLVHAQDFGKDNTISTLNFRKSEATDLYFFNSYNLALKNEQRPDGIKQNYYISPKGDNITLKEGYNLLSGRAIEKEYIPKEGEKYKAWLQLDFKETDTNGQFKLKQFHPNYGFDLEAALHKHPIMELNTVEGTKRLLESLQRGNRQQVTYGDAGNERKVFIEASPQFKSVNFYGESFKRVLATSLQTKPAIAEIQRQDIPEIAPVVSLTTKEGKKEAAKEEQEAPQKQKRQKVRR